MNCPPAPPPLRNTTRAAFTVTDVVRKEKTTQVSGSSLGAKIQGPGNLVGHQEDAPLWSREQVRLQETKVEGKAASV